MWVFDGEEWTQDNGEPKTARDKRNPQRLEEFEYDFFPEPELQIVEITDVRRRHTDVPPLPMP